MGRIYRPSDQGITLEEHTADLWLVTEGSSVEEVFKRALMGLYGVIASEFEISGEKDEREEFRGPSPEEILIDILSEALYLFDAESRMITDPIFRLEKNEEGLRVEMRFRSVEASITDGSHGMEIKAATYHGADMVTIGDVHRARILLDL